MEENAYKPQNELKESGKNIYKLYMYNYEMIEIEAVIRKWGNSVGVIIPKDVAEKEGLNADEKVEIFISRKEKTRVKDVFGKLKLKEPVEKIMRETDEELRGDF